MTLERKPRAAADKRHMCEIPPKTVERGLTGAKPKRVFVNKRKTCEKQPARVPHYSDSIVATWASEIISALLDKHPSLKERARTIHRCQLNDVRLPEHPVQEASVAANSMTLVS